MGRGRPPLELRGRRRERDALGRLVSGLRAGRGEALVLRGEHGIGKTALLEYAAERARGCRVCRVGAAESERELAFAGLHQLCGPLLDYLDRLRGPEREALAVAFGLSGGAASGRFAIGLGVLSLLSEAAAEQPILCLIDDAEWLDRPSAHALAFAARRLAADPVGFVFATPEATPELAGLRELEVEGLEERDAGALLDSVVQGPLDERVRKHILSETRGNPLALLELPRGLTPAELAGGFGLPGALPLPARVEETFTRRLGSLPSETRQLLLVAAAEPAGDPALLWRAAERLGLGASAAAPAREAGLLDVGDAVRFRHPLARRAVYRAASPADRRAAHGALADVTDAEREPDQRAWHRAHAVVLPHEDIARELEASASRAQARGGLAAAAAFLERSAALTPSARERARRALAAARAAHAAGDPAKARELIPLAASGPLDPLPSALLDRLRGQVEFSERRTAGSSALLLRAARELEPLDVRLARETHLESVWVAMHAADRESLVEAAEAARAAPSAPPPARPIDLVLDAIALRYTNGYAAAFGAMRSALEAFEVSEDARWVNLVTRAAIDVWDERSWCEFASGHVRLARESGALDVLPMALNMQSAWLVFSGSFNAAELLLGEADGIAEATGNARVSDMWLVLAAWRGDEQLAAARLEAGRRDARARGDRRILALAGLASALLNTGYGRYEAALESARSALETDALGFGPAGMFELAEAAARAGRLEIASDVVDEVAQQARLARTDWALGSESACRALISEGAEAEACYVEAVERLSRTRLRTYWARTLLLYGEWLRRERRRVDAREHLRQAQRLFTDMGALAFADRAARELAATGEHARARTAEATDQLTPQEIRIAGLARDGRTNQEIGEQLFISPRTVEYHLHKVFAKLDISSRAELKVVELDVPPLPQG